MHPIVKQSLICLFSTPRSSPAETANIAIGWRLSPACFNSDSIPKATRLSSADTKTTDFLYRYSSSEKTNKVNYKQQRHP